MCLKNTQDLWQGQGSSIRAQHLCLLAILGLLIWTLLLPTLCCTLWTLPPGCLNIVWRHNCITLNCTCCHIEGHSQEGRIIKYSRPITEHFGSHSKLSEYILTLQFRNFCGKVTIVLHILTPAQTFSRQSVKIKGALKAYQNFLGKAKVVLCTSYFATRIYLTRPKIH